MFKRCFKRRGQVLVLYALLIPLLFLFAGIGIDLGWYYLNVSRLQNAADAAVIAGAQALVKDLNSKDNSSTSITTQTSTSGNTNTITNTTTTTTVTYGYQGLVDKYPADKPDPTSTTSGDDVARQYVAKNLGKREGDSIIDYWSKGGDPKVTMTPSLYKDDSGYYYVVHLTEKIQHLFMPGWFKAMDAPVVAVAVISKKEQTPIIPRDPGKGSEQELPDGTDILTEMYKLEDKYVVRNWEWEKNATVAQYEAFMHKKSTMNPEVGRNIKRKKRKFTTPMAKNTEPSRYMFTTEVKARAAQSIPLQKTSLL